MNRMIVPATAALFALSSVAVADGQLRTASDGPVALTDAQMDGVTAGGIRNAPGLDRAPGLQKAPGLQTAPGQGKGLEFIRDRVFELPPGNGNGNGEIGG